MAQIAQGRYKFNCVQTKYNLNYEKKPFIEQVVLKPWIPRRQMMLTSQIPQIAKYSLDFNQVCTVITSP